MYIFLCIINKLAGKGYQELKVRKRARRQPEIIQDLPYLHWERTGQPPLGPYGVSGKTTLIVRFLL